MLRSKLLSLLSVLVLAGLALGACAPAPATVEVTRVVPGTPETLVVTATALPPPERKAASPLGRRARLGAEPD